MAPPPDPKQGPSVHYNGNQMFLPKPEMTGQELYQFFQVPANHRLFLEAQGKDPDKRIENDATGYSVKNGSQFYDLPHGQFGALLPRVDKELADLRTAYGAERVSTREEPDGSVLVLIKEVPVPTHWTKPSVTLRIVVPPSYPQGRPDGFFTDKDLFLSATKTPGQGGGQTGKLPDGSEWLKFCWAPKTWDMSRETLLRYAKFCEDRFKEKT